MVLLFLKRRSVTLTQSSPRKPSTGAIEHVPVIRVTNLAKTIDELKDNGFWVAGTEANNATDYRNLESGHVIGYCNW
ncbi:TrmH family RNA methyltransferase [Staphylococcus aureus]